METLGILIFRTEKIGKDPAQVWVYRLSGLGGATCALGRDELKDQALEASKGCSLYSVSHREHSSLRLAIITGRKVLLYRWIHAEEWIAFTADTVEGFELIKEINLVEQPLLRCSNGCSGVVGGQQDGVARHPQLHECLLTRG